jgi:hypothetical protein
LKWLTTAWKEIVDCIKIAIRQIDLEEVEHIMSPMLAAEDKRIFTLA